jgi:DNA-cytosine methyltransferase
MKILSLFDGISCGRVALDRAGIPIEAYYASEIDKYAITVSCRNWPDIEHIGSVTDIDPADYAGVDMIIGGSPCQGFSFAGKQLNFQDERSKLFFEFVRLVKAIHPKYFLLENVLMKQEYIDVISRELGAIYPECTQQTEMFESPRLEPIMINSALVSAQSRKRLYWCNWKVSQPVDKGIMMQDVLKYGAWTDKDKSYCIDASYYKGAPVESYKNKCRRQLVKCGRITGRNPKSRRPGLPTEQMPEIRDDDKTGTLTTVQKDNVLCKTVDRNPDNTSDKKYVRRLELRNDGKSGTITTATSHNQANDLYALAKPAFNDYEYWRKLTPVECERLQTLPDGYTEGISNTQRYKCLGNGWTVDVIAHILKQI